VENQLNTPESKTRAAVLAEAAAMARAVEKQGWNAAGNQDPIKQTRHKQEDEGK
jgi:hypothetical protein